MKRLKTVHFNCTAIKQLKQILSNNTWDFSMVDQDKRRAVKRELKQELGILFEAISEILLHHDPIHINFGCNSDEYEPEVGTILPRLMDCHSVESVKKMVHEEFTKWFSPMDVGKVDKYEAIAEEIWHVWRDHTFPWINAEITLLSTSVGGREHPLDLSDEAYYRPHIVIGNRMQREPTLKEGTTIDEEYLGVQFRPCQLIVSPGESTILKLELMYYPAVEYDKLVLDIEFTIREGPKIIGHGKVLTVGYE